MKRPTAFLTRPTAQKASVIGDGGVDGFVSYARSDASRVMAVVAAMRRRGRVIWLDSADIPPGAVWRQQLRRAIEESKSVICFVSPAWSQSAECRAEVELAISLGKRLVPVIIAPVAASSLPSDVRAVQWIDATHGDDEQTAAAAIAAIDIDPERVRDHTFWLAQALRWEAAGQHRSQLARGRSLRAAEAWLQLAGHDPAPTPLHSAFVAASRRAERRRGRLQLSLALVGIVITSSLAAIAVQQRNTAITERNTARSRGLAVASSQQLTRDPMLALLLARAGWQSAHTSEALSALRAAVHGSLIRASIHTGTGVVAAAAGTGSMLLSGSTTGHLTSWDAATGRRLDDQQLPGRLEKLSMDHADDRGIALTQNHRAATFAVAGNGQLTMQAAATGVDTSAMSSDGRTAVLGLADGALQRSVGGAPFTSVAQVRSDESPASLTVSQNGGVTAIGTGLRNYRSGLPKRGVTEGRLYVSDARGFRLLATYLTPVTTVVLDSSGTLILSVAEDGSGTVRRVSSGQVVLAIRHGFAAALDPTGRYAVVSTLQGATTVGSVATGRWRSLAGRSVPLYGLGFGADGNLIVGASAAGAGYVWSTSTGRQAAQLLGSSAPATAIAVEANGVDVVSGHANGDLNVWQLPPAITQVRLGSPTVNQTGGIAVHSASVSPDGSVVLTSADNGLVQTWNATGASKCLAGGEHLDAGICPLTVAAVSQLPNLRLDTLASFSPDGHSVAVLASDGALAVFAATKIPIVTARAAADGGAVDSGTLAYSPDGKLILVQRGDRPPTLIEASTGRVVAVLATPPSEFYQAAWMSSAQLVVADVEGDVGMYDVAGHLVRRLGRVDGNPLAIAVAPGARTVAVAVATHVILLDATTGKQILTYDEDTADVDALAISADGSYVVSGSLDGTARLWDITTGTTVSVLSIPGSQFVSVAFDQAKHTVIAGGQNSAFYLDACDVCIAPDNLARLAALRTTRTLTDAERRQFGVGNLLT